MFCLKLLEVTDPGKMPPLHNPHPFLSLPQMTPPTILTPSSLLQMVIILHQILRRKTGISSSVILAL